MKYRKKPLVIEAWQWNGNLLENCKDVPQWIWDAEEEDDLKLYYDWEPEDRFIEIETLEGTMRGEIGDYIIKGIQGELYPCKPDIFLKTYEEVPE